MRGLAVAALTGWVFLGTHLYGEYKRALLLTRVAELEVTASMAQRQAEQLGNGGRFIRRYDPKQGRSIYVYAPGQTNRYERVRLCGWENYGRPFAD